MKLFVGEPDFLKGNWRGLIVEPANRRQFGAFVGSNCLNIYRNQGQRKARCFPHHFGGFPLKKQNVQVKKGIGSCCPGFYTLFSCHQTRNLQKPFKCRIIKLRKRLNIVWQSHYFSRCYKISWP